MANSTDLRSWTSMIQFHLRNSSNRSIAIRTQYIRKRTSITISRMATAKRSQLPSKQLILIVAMKGKAIMGKATMAIRVTINTVLAVVKETSTPTCSTTHRPSMINSNIITVMVQGKKRSTLLVLRVIKAIARLLQ